LPNFCLDGCGPFDFRRTTAGWEGLQAEFGTRGDGGHSRAARAKGAAQ